jgi:dTDP-4-dehydrorhamnose 3,5-epimerase
MRFTPLPVHGAYLIDLEHRTDERGFFARFFCKKEFAQHGLEASFAQANDSYSKEKGTLRGMHYQLGSAAEAKLVRCIRGSLYDVVADICPSSPTYGKWHGALLTEQNRQMLYVPRTCAHGFLTIEPETEVLYLVSHPYDKDQERGFRWNDPHFNIAWPHSPSLVSERDRSHPDFIQHI